MRVIEHNRFPPKPASNRPPTPFFHLFPYVLIRPPSVVVLLRREGDWCRSMVDIFSFRLPLCSSVSLRLCGECFPSGFWILNSVRSFLTPALYHPWLDIGCPSRFLISASKPPPQTAISPQIPRAIASS